jgi:hypothetical protein
LPSFVRKALLTTGIAALTLFAVQAASAADIVGVSINLGWNANTEPDIAGYRVYTRTVLGNYGQGTDVGNVTAAIVPNLTPGSVYYFRVTAYNTVGLESAPSDEVLYIALVQPTPTPTPTPTPGPTSTPVAISGAISYCSNPSPGPVPNVTLTLTGSASGSTLSDGSGNYQLSSLAPGGSYIVTPTKSALPPGSAGISTVDVIAVQRHFLNLALLPLGCQRTAADVNGDMAINTVDTIAIQRFYLGRSTGIGNTGSYQFTPASRAYVGIVSNQTGQNYDTLVLGDVASGFVYGPEGPSLSLPPDAMVAEIALPQISVDSFVTNFLAEVTTTSISAADNLVAFQGDFRFDSSVITFESQPVQNAGLTAGNWNVSGNVLPGEGPVRTLRISAYSNDLTPLSGSGTLFKLSMTRVSGTPGACTALAWEEMSSPFIFIDADLNTQPPRDAASGSVSLP